MEINNLKNIPTHILVMKNYELIILFLTIVTYKNMVNVMKEKKKN